MPLQLNPTTGELELVGLQYVEFDRAPTTADNGYKVPSGWLDTTLDEWYILVDITNEVATWKAAGGDVTGPASATDNALARFDGTTGKLIQNSVGILDDAGALSGLTQLDVDNLRLDGNTISSTDTAGDVIIAPDTTGGAVVTTDLTVGNTSQDVDFTINGASISATVSVEGTNSTDLGGVIGHRHSDTAGFGGHFVNLRSRGTHATPTVVADDDVLSLYAIGGFDGTDYALAGTISCEVDNPPGADDMPGRWVFSTSADGAQTPIEAMRIDSTQVVTLANALPVASGGTGQTTYTNGQLLIGNTTGNTLAKATLTAGSGITITNGTGSIQIDATGGGFTWNEETGTSATITIEEGYIANNAGLVTLTMPAAASVGQEFAVVGKGAGLFKIAQNAGQTVHFVNTDTTTGTGGSLTAIDQYAAIQIICITANTDFAVVNSAGNFTIV